MIQAKLGILIIQEIAVRGKMKEHGLMFTGEMIQAFLEHRKSMTRRVQGLEKINENPDDWELIGALCYGHIWYFRNIRNRSLSIEVKCPYAVGDFIYAKETWATLESYDNLKPTELPDKAPIWYKFDYPVDMGVHMVIGRWRSSMFMPKKVARTWREIVGVRCERLQTISKEDIENEGEPFMSLPDKCLLNFGYTKPYEYTREHFAYFWDRLNGKKHPWAKNDWVWPLSLKEVKK